MTNLRIPLVAAIALGFALSTSFAQAPLPQPLTRGGVTYLNGGAGSEEVDFIKSSMKDYSLALSFSRSGGEYVANVAVTIKDGKGATVFEAPSAGPYLLVKLPAGRYVVDATYQNVPMTVSKTVGGAATAVTALQWK